MTTASSMQPSQRTTPVWLRVFRVFCIRDSLQKGVECFEFLQDAPQFHC
jgi:hypothetical protein